ncbi:MAG: hypothetical protein WBC92_00520 [Terracidiphilus sp.]
MKKSSADKEKREKKSKIEKKPVTAGGVERTTSSKNYSESLAKEMPEGDKDKAPKKDDKAKHADAKKALRVAVKKAVKERSKKLAQSLVGRTENGDMRGAAMMLSLMEKQKDCKEENKEWDGPTVAELLESEPEWDESMEDNSEGGMDGDEPV